MDKPGEMQMLSGGVFFLVGVFATFILPALVGGGVIILAWGALIFGPVQFFMGFNRRFPDAFKNKAMLRAELDQLEVDYLGRAMVYTAMAEPLTLERAHDIVRTMDASPAAEGAVRPRFEDVRAWAIKDYDNYLFLNRSAVKLSAEVRGRVLSACEALAAQQGPAAADRVTDLRGFLAA